MSKKGIAVLDAPEQKIGVKAATKPTQEQIAARAHELFLQRGSITGHELEDWLEAEKELLDKA